MRAARGGEAASGTAPRLLSGAPRPRGMLCAAEREAAPGDEAERGGGTAPRVEATPVGGLRPAMKLNPVGGGGLRPAMKLRLVGALRPG